MKPRTSAFLRIEKGQVEGYYETDEITLSTDVTLIGRPTKSPSTDNENPDIKIRNDYVSRSHLKIYYSYESDCFAVQESDIGTKNGTFINSDRLKPGKSYNLKDGDLIKLARVRGDYEVVLRFRESEATLLGEPETERHPTKGLSIDMPARRVWIDGQEIPLRRKEYDLIAFLYKNKGKACNRDEIIEAVWPEWEENVNNQTVDSSIYRIRKAINDSPSKPRYIRTVRNYGFRLDD